MEIRVGPDESFDVRAEAAQLQVVWHADDQGFTVRSNKLPEGRKTLQQLFGEGPVLGCTLGKLALIWDEDVESMLQHARLIRATGATWARINFGKLTEDDKREYAVALDAGFNVFGGYWPPEGRGKKRPTTRDEDKRNLDHYLHALRWFSENGGMPLVQYGNEWWLRSEQFDARTPVGNERHNRIILEACEESHAAFPDTLFGMYSLVFTHWFHSSHRDQNHLKVEIWPEVLQKVDAIPIQHYGHSAAEALRWLDFGLDHWVIPEDKTWVSETGLGVDLQGGGQQGQVRGNTPEAKAREMKLLVPGTWERINNRLVTWYCASEQGAYNRPSPRGYGLLQTTAPEGTIVPFEPEYSTFSGLIAEHSALTKYFQGGA